ncbi:MAG: hypothetical protein D9V47_04765 [Clostridia bacterium]|nr:MAG: hypothetical protein D9V47_04765 [Clostridia bacterium]
MPIILNPLPKNIFAKWEESQAAAFGSGSSGLGTPIIPRNLHQKFYELVEKAEISRLNLHALRHSFATRLPEEGEGLKVVQELLGCSRIDTTADIYSHVSRELKWRAAEKINGILAAAGTKWAPKKGFEEARLRRT